MTHYEERLASDLKVIRGDVAELLRRVERAVRQSTEAMLESDPEQASLTIIEDNPINRLARSIDEHCHEFIVRHLPSAGHLRFISSVLRLTVAIERIGDYAGSIAREALMLSKHLPKSVAKDIRLMVDQSLTNLDNAARAFLEGDEELARRTQAEAKISRDAFSDLYPDLIKVGSKHSRPPQDLFAFLITFYRLERITDQAKNICEETLFSVAGEVKEYRATHILFVDERCDYLAPLAATLAAKAYPESGVYTAAGMAPAGGLAPAARTYMEEHGLDESAVAMGPLHLGRETLSQFDLVIGLEGDLRERLGDLPFRTVLLHWQLEHAAEGASPDADRMEALHEELSVNIQDLIGLLAGPEAH